MILLQKYFWFLANRTQSYSVMFLKTMDTQHWHYCMVTWTFLFIFSICHSSNGRVKWPKWKMLFKNWCSPTHTWDTHVCFREIHPEFSTAPVNTVSIRQPLDCFIRALKACDIDLSFQQVSEGVEVNSKGRHNWMKTTVLLAHEKLKKYWLPKRSEIGTLPSATSILRLWNRH